MSLSETVKRIQAPTFIHFHHSCSLLPGLRLELKAHMAGTKRKLSGGRRSKQRHPIKSAELSVSEEAILKLSENYLHLAHPVILYTTSEKFGHTFNDFFFFSIFITFYIVDAYGRQQIYVQDAWNYQANIFFDNSVKTATLQFNHS